MRDRGGPLLPAVDLEEFYGVDRRPAAGATPLAELVELLLEVFRVGGVRATFFTVGEVARTHPSVVVRVAEHGHEIACHGDRHLPMDRFDESAFADDLRANRAAIEALGLPTPTGFRAPLMSLDARCAWAHRVLREEGFAYSSSVLPARTPQYGWPEFGSAPRECAGVLELPASVVRVGPVLVPCLAATYYRLLPDFLARRLVRIAARRGAVVGYVHPWDVDARQPRTRHAELAERPLLNRLLFVRRGSMSARIQRLLTDGWPTSTYREFAGAFTGRRSGRCR
jgi:polysaccharide deacetylase family protein (PEP-CTERM system associated)